MKIGVITFWHGNSNYGQILQCWALQEFLRRQGHEPFVIRFIPHHHQPRIKAIIKSIIPVQFIRRICLWVFNHRKWRLREQIKHNDKLREFDTFRKCKISFSPLEYHTIWELRKNAPNADCYITGSDQVWAQMLSNPNHRAYFLDFGKEHVLRIAYAPSFVVAHYPDTLQPLLKTMLERIDFISVREYSGVDICKLLGFSARKVLDPTFLLDKSDYELIARKKGNFKQIFIYSINIKSSEDIYWYSLKQFAKTQGLNIIITPASGYFEGAELFGEHENYQYSTVEEWLGNMVESELIVTTSFHGVALSVILHRPFVYIPLRGDFVEGNSRVLDLLMDLGLQDRILTNSRSYSYIYSSAIDWHMVDDLLSKQQEVSRGFLVNGIVSGICEKQY